MLGVLGVILTGLGMVFMMLYNWSSLSLIQKTVASFLPLSISQGFNLFVLLKKRNHLWRETVSVFTFIAIGTTLLLVDQAYPIAMSHTFLLIIWMLLFLPSIYLMGSSFGALMYISGVVFVALDTQTQFCWILLLLLFPYYYLRYRNKYEEDMGWVFVLHQWGLPISLFVIGFNLMNSDMPSSMLILFYFAYLLGAMKIFQPTNQYSWYNGFHTLGKWAMVLWLLIISHLDTWSSSISVISLKSNELYIYIIFMLLTLTLFYIDQKNKSPWKADPFSMVFLIVLWSAFWGNSLPLLTSIFINIALFLIATFEFFRGWKNNDAKSVISGALIFVALVFFRAIELNMTFILKGSLFGLLGIAFLLLNYFVISKKKSDEKI